MDEELVDDDEGGAEGERTVERFRLCATLCSAVLDSRRVFPPPKRFFYSREKNWLHACCSSVFCHACSSVVISQAHSAFERLGSCKHTVPRLKLVAPALGAAICTIKPTLEPSRAEESFWVRYNR